MDLLTALVLLNVALLQFEGVWSQDHLYHRTGEDTTLSCERFTHDGPECSDVYWYHWILIGVIPSTLVKNGQIVNIPRSSRLTLNPDCSLTVHNIREEDFGLYRCDLQTSSGVHSGKLIYLSVLSVSPAPSNQNGHVTLQCSLRRYSALSCPQNSLRWLDVNGTVLSGDGVTQDKCVSNLTVERESQHQRTFTCQFVEDGEVKVEFRPEGNSDSSDLDKSSRLVYVASAAGASVLVLLAVAAVVVFKIKSKRNSSQTIQDTEDDQQMTDRVADPENNVTYATIDLQKPRAQRQGKVNQEDFVTYSAVNVKTGSDSDHSAIYSDVHKPATD